MKLTPKQKAFADYYIETGNAEQSALRAGYSDKYARSDAYKLPAKTGIKSYIAEKMKQLESERIATAKEVLEYLTKGLRQELEEEVIVVEGIGDGCSEATIKKKKISIKESNACADRLAKILQMYEKQEEDKDEVEDDGFFEALKGEVENIWED